MSDPLKNPNSQQRMTAIIFRHVPSASIPYMAQYECQKCGHKSQWYPARKMEDIEKGAICPICRQWKPGDRVVVNDHSEAHGDSGVVEWVQADGLVMVTLDQGCIWPIEGKDLRPLPDVWGEIQ